MHLDFAVVADYALVDQSGKMSVLGIFQHIWVPQFPAMHPRLHLVLRLKGKRTEVGEHQVQIKLLDEDDAELLGCSCSTCRSRTPVSIGSRSPWTASAKPTSRLRCRRCPRRPRSPLRHLRL